MSMYNPLGWAQGAVYKNIKSTDEFIDAVGADLVVIMKNTLEHDDKVYTGAAVDSIDYDKGAQVVFSDLIYVYNLEFGREKGSLPPLHKIHSWVEHKLNIHPPDSMEIAKRIQHSIAQNGIPATRFTKRSILQLLGNPIKKTRVKTSKWHRMLRTFSNKAKNSLKKTIKVTKSARKHVKKANRTKNFIRRVSKSKGKLGRRF